MIGETTSSGRLPRIDLAGVPDFDLGGIRIRPARRQVCLPGGDCRDLEPRVMQVLVALAKARGEVVSRDQLIEACWDGRIVGDDSLNRCVVALRRLAKGIDPPPFAIETVARVGYSLVERPTDAADGEGEEAVVRFGAPAAARPWRRVLVAFAATAIAVALAIFLWPAGLSDAEAPLRVRLGDIRSLTSDLAPTMARGFREELIASIETEDSILLVASGTGDVKRGPALAISATIQKAGDQLRFTSHLTNERSGVSIWSQRIELPVAFAAFAPRRVAMSVSQVIRCGLGPGPALAELTDRQLSLWLQFCQEAHSGQPTTPERTVDAARRVTMAAPNFSRGWSSLAIAAVPAPNKFTHGDAAALHAESAHAAERALRLNPRDSDAYCARAIAQVDRRAWAAVEALLQKAIAVQPTDCACARLLYGVTLSAVGRLEDSVGQYQRYHDERPLTSTSHAFLAEALFVAGYGDEGERLLAETFQLWPDEDAVLTLKLRRAFWTGRYDDASAILADRDFRSPLPRRAAFAAAFAALRDGRPASRLKAAELLKSVARDPRENTRSVTIALAAIGENRAAIESAEQNAAYTRGVLFDPSFARARHEPAFEALVQRLGMVRYWRQSRHLPDFCKAANAPALCARL